MAVKNVIAVKIVCVHPNTDVMMNAIAVTKKHKMNAHAITIMHVIATVLVHINRQVKMIINNGLRWRFIFYHLKRIK